MSNLKISDLTPDDKNYNKGSEFGNSLIEKSLRKFGAGRSILLDKNNRIIAGNKTIENAGAIGLDDIIVVETTGNQIVAVKRMDIDLDSKQGRELALADNASAKANINWDFETINFDWNETEIKEWGLEIPDFEVLEAEEDDFAVPDGGTETDIVLGDLFEIGEHRLLCGDSTDSDQVAKLMNGQKADMVFTDPPYGINAVSKSGVLKESYGVDILGDSNTNAACDAFSLIYSLYPNATHIWWGANHYSLDAKLPNAKCWLTWDKQEKNNHIDQADCELAWTNINSPARIFHHLWAGFRRDSEKGEKRVHPTQKPIQLISEILQHFKKVKSELILDLFLGSGSTMAASHQLKRKCFGMELDPKYCQVIVDRMKKLDPTLIIKKNGVTL